MIYHRSQCIFLIIASFLDIFVLRGSVATCSGRGGIFKHDFITNLPLSLSVKNVKNRLTLGEVMGKCLVFFFWLTVYSCISVLLMLVAVGYVWKTAVITTFVQILHWNHFENIQLLLNAILSSIGWLSDTEQCSIAVSVIITKCYFAEFLYNFSFVQLKKVWTWLGCAVAIFSGSLSNLLR